jgi:uncharacterized Zn finger protein
MGLLECASRNSAWRGYEYYEKRKVESVRSIGQTQYEAVVSGNGVEPYTTVIDVAHPRKSTCTCPHAEGRRIVCKHMMAVFFTVCPEAAKTYYNTVVRVREVEEQADLEDEDLWAEEEWSEETEDELIRCVERLSKKQLEQMLLELLDECPDWLFEQFVQNNLGLDFGW